MKSPVLSAARAAALVRRARGRGRPVVLGLTGSIGMGKSAVARMFRGLGVPVFDADRTVRAVQGPGGAALAAIEARFPGVTGEAGLDRAALGARVFGDSAALADLEGIVHPIVAARRDAFLRRHRFRRVVVLDVPLLLEGRTVGLCDLVLVVSAPFRVERARVLARAGMSEARFRGVLAQQMADRVKRRLADVVIETGRGRLLTWRTVRGVAAALRPGAGDPGPCPSGNWGGYPGACVR